MPDCPSSHGENAFFIRPHQLPCAASVNAFPDADFSLAAKFTFHILAPRPDSSKQSAGFYNPIEVDLKELVDELQLRDVAAPMLVRFPDILDNRIEKIANCFKQASDE